MKHVDQSLKTISKGAGILLLGILVSKILSYVYRVIVARFLSPEEYGLLSLGLAVLGVAIVFALLGLPTGIERFIGYYTGKKDKIKGVISSGLQLSTGLSIIIAALVFFFANTIAEHIFKNTAATPIIQIFAIAIPFYVICDILYSAIRGLRKVQYEFYIKDLTNPLLRIAITIALLFFGFRVFGAAIAYLVTLIICVILAFRVIRKKQFGLADKTVQPIFMKKELLAFSWPLLLSSICFSLMTWTDTLMLGYFVTEDLVGIYNAALPTAALVMIFFNGFKGLFVPVTSELFAKKNFTEISKVFTTTTRWIFMITFPCLLLLIFFSQQLLTLLFGAPYALGANALIIVSIGLFIATMVGPTAQMLNALGRTKVNLLSRVIASVANIILNLVLIPRYGLIGAALATALSVIIFNVITLTYVRYYVKMHPYNWSYFKPFLAAIVTAGIIFPIAYYFFQDVLWIFLPAGVIFLGLYAVLAVLFKSLEQEDKLMIEALEKRLGYDLKKVKQFIHKFS